MFVWKEKNGVKYLEITEFKDKNVTAIFTSRLGGISIDKYSSLNLAFHTGDKQSNVRQNRKIIAEKLNIDHRSFVAGEQVHKDRICVVDEKDRGKGALSLESSIKGVDALITNRHNIPLISFYADCVPLLIMDPIRDVIGLAHAGWKGTVLKIGAKTINKMANTYGTAPEDCWVGIGPSISRDNFEVDDLVINKFKKSFNNWNEFAVYTGKGHYNFDLWSSNKYTLNKVGVPLKQIIVSDYCTVDNEQFFYSYRRDKGKTGRMASIIKF